MEQKKITLSVALAVYNEEKNLDRCLSSVRHLADEIIVVDGGSTDTTVHIAKSHGAKVILTDNPMIFHINKQKALDACRGIWIFQLDADEVIPDQLAKELTDIMNKETAGPNGYFVPRRNYFCGVQLKKGGLYPDYVIRFFKNGKGKFPSQSVHEQIQIEGSVDHLIHPLYHYSYSSHEEYWKKAYAYITLESEDMRKRRVNISLSSFISYMLVKPFLTFLSRYIRHKGFMDGWNGFVFALFSALHYPKAYCLYMQSLQNKS